MSPDSLETRFAGLLARVEAWEYQLRTQGPLVTQYEVLRSELGRANRDIQDLHTELNQRIHELNEEQEQDRRREVQALHERITRIADRRDRQFADFDKRIGDVALTLKADIDDCREAAVVQRGEWTTRRGQNLALMGVILVGILGLVQAVLNGFG